MSLSSQKTPSGLAQLNEGRFLLYISTLQELIPFLYISVLESGPYIDRLTEEMSAIGDNEGRYTLVGHENSTSFHRFVLTSGFKCRLRGFFLKSVKCFCFVFNHTPW